MKVYFAYSDPHRIVDVEYPDGTFRLEIPDGLKDDAGRTLANARSFPLRVRTDDAQLAGNAQVRPDAPGGRADLTLSAPGASVASSASAALSSAPAPGASPAPSAARIAASAALVSPSEPQERTCRSAAWNTSGVSSAAASLHSTPATASPGCSERLATIGRSIAPMPPASMIGLS